jgi:hypothetical protein
MALLAGSTYNVPTPGSEEDPDFTYETDDKDEEIYALLFLGVLLKLYEDKYKGKNADAVLKRIDKDISDLNGKFNNNILKLNDLFENVARKQLLEAGILEDNIKKVKFDDDIKNRILEQKQTIKGILTELQTNLKATAYHLKDRKAEQLYDTKPKFSRAAKRLKQMIEAGYTNVQAKALRQVQIFLYDDPEARLVTAGDANVCADCRIEEKKGWVPLSQLKYVPLHNRCRCHIELKNKKPKMSDEAILLMYYTVGELT